MVRRPSTCVSLACFLAAAGVLARPATVRMQTAPTLADATLTHLCVVVPDVDAAARRYADLFGLAPLTIRSQAPELPDGTKVEVRSTNVMLTNFHIELNQPISPIGPLYEHLTKYGPSVQHIGLSIDADIDLVRAALEQKGGRWTLGPRGGIYAYLDFRDQIGTSIEIIRGRPRAPAATPPAETGLFGGRPLTHFGVAIPDVDGAVRAYAGIFGIQPAVKRRFPDPHHGAPRSNG
jgi:catechol 2,3-dioxygenase-like lactoylglutathione lyase family enzyme